MPTTRSHKKIIKLSTILMLQFCGRFMVFNTTFNNISGDGRVGRRLLTAVCWREGGSTTFDCCVLKGGWVDDCWLLCVEGRVGRWLLTAVCWREGETTTVDCCVLKRGWVDDFWLLCVEGRVGRRLLAAVCWREGGSTTFDCCVLKGGWVDDFWLLCVEGSPVFVYH
jgi:hypothetical protein